MKRSAMRRAVAVAALGAAVLLGGCGDKSGPQDASGTWEGRLDLRLTGGDAFAGDLTLVLDQEDGFASGIAEWVPFGEPQSIAGPIEGLGITLRLIFRCEETFETAQLEGTVSGDTIRITRASGMACTLLGTPQLVESGDATLARTSNDLPL